MSQNRGRKTNSIQKLKQELLFHLWIVMEYKFCSELINGFKNKKISHNFVPNFILIIFGMEIFFITNFRPNFFLFEWTNVTLSKLVSQYNRFPDQIVTFVHNFFCLWTNVNNVNLFSFFNPISWLIRLKCNAQIWLNDKFLNVYLVSFVFNII